MENIIVQLSGQIPVLNETIHLQCLKIDKLEKKNVDAMRIEHKDKMKVIVYKFDETIEH